MISSKIHIRFFIAMNSNPFRINIRVLKVKNIKFVFVLYDKGLLVHHSMRLYRN